MDGDKKALARSESCYAVIAVGKSGVMAAF
jgi:hypothetical protein